MKKILIGLLVLGSICTSAQDLRVGDIIDPLKLNLNATSSHFSHGECLSNPDANADRKVTPIYNNFELNDGAKISIYLFNITKCDVNDAYYEFKKLIHYGFDSLQEELDLIESIISTKKHIYYSLDARTCYRNVMIVNQRHEFEPGGSSLDGYLHPKTLQPAQKISLARITIKCPDNGAIMR